MPTSSSHRSSNLQVKLWSCKYTLPNMNDVDILEWSFCTDLPLYKLQTPFWSAWELWLCCKIQVIGHFQPE